MVEVDTLLLLAQVANDESWSLIESDSSDAISFQSAEYCESNRSNTPTAVFHDVDRPGTPSMLELGVTSVAQTPLLTRERAFDDDDALADGDLASVSDQGEPSPRSARLIVRNFDSYAEHMADSAIAEQEGVDRATVWRWRQKLIKEGVLQGIQPKRHVRQKQSKSKNKHLLRKKRSMKRKHGRR